jgi:UDP-N-acetylglucosamine 2-epimerase (non-hydrolysing)
MKQIIHVVGARPNFMKAAPVIAALRAYAEVRQSLVHTGQHYDENMSEIFFRQLGMPEPHVNLEVGSGSHAAQTAQIMLRFQEWLDKDRPDLVIVYGDINSTMAASIVCSKLGIPVAHVEAGLRSFDRSMPEEINRLVTDRIANLLLTPSVDGNQNLIREGVEENKIHLVGNTMIDTLVSLLPKARMLSMTQDLGPWRGKKYALVTLHRPSNVDDHDSLTDIMLALLDIGDSLPVVFPVHPRTRTRLRSIEGLRLNGTVHMVDPLGYLEFLAMQTDAAVVITDSGGIQEETTFLGVPCLTLRENTERPVTVTMGTNTLVGHDMNRLREEVSNIIRGNAKKGKIPPLWDGKAGERIALIVAGSESGPSSVAVSNEERDRT